MKYKIGQLVDVTAFKDNRGLLFGLGLIVDIIEGVIHNYRILILETNDEYYFAESEFREI